MSPSSAGPSPSLRCDQCGRVGTRRFRTLPGFTDRQHGEFPPIHECSGKIACRRRWTREARAARRKGST